MVQIISPECEQVKLLGPGPVQEIKLLGPGKVSAKWEKQRFYGDLWRLMGSVPGARVDFYSGRIYDGEGIGRWMFHTNPQRKRTWLSQYVSAKRQLMNRAEPAWTIEYHCVFERGEIEKRLRRKDFSHGQAARYRLPAASGELRTAAGGFALVSAGDAGARGAAD